MARSMRRHHKQRLKNTRRMFWGRDLSGDARALGMVVKTPATCSCLACGNLRQAVGATRQERRAEVWEGY